MKLPGAMAICYGACCDGRTESQRPLLTRVRYFCTLNALKALFGGLNQVVPATRHIQNFPSFCGAAVSKRLRTIILQKKLPLRWYLFGRILCSQKENGKIAARKNRPKPAMGFAASHRGYSSACVPCVTAAPARRAAATSTASAISASEQPAVLALFV